MVYIKLQVSDGSTVGVEALENPVYIKWQEKHRLKLTCPLTEAQGIMSSDGEQIYQLVGREALKGVEEDTLNASFIDEFDYEMLKSQLDDPAEETDEADETEQAENMDAQSEIMTAAQMRARIIALENTVNGGAAAVSDEATAKFYATLADSSTNSIAKIRAAAQQYLDDTSTAETAESEEA